jgi:hypothetical protein
MNILRHFCILAAPLAASRSPRRRRDALGEEGFVTEVTDFPHGIAL